MNTEFHSPTTCSALKERDERLDSLKSFAGRMVHDFRNGIVPLLGYVTLVKEETGENASVKPYLQKLESATQKLENYLSTVSAAVRPERHFVPKTCDFAALLERVCQAWRSGLPSTPSIGLEMTLAPCTLVVDEAQWCAVIEQLLKNAQFALSAGGTVAVTLRARAMTREQAAALSLETTEVFELIVRDTGSGMVESVLKRACEPFLSTRPKRQALGLGLTLAHGVTRLHGGQLVLESVENAGTTVTIYLTAHRQRPKEAEGSLSQSASGPVARLTK